MRALLVSVAGLCCAGWVALALLPALAADMPLQPRVGHSITQTQLFAYLFTVPQPGDWLRYRLSADDNTILFKTVGFGAADEQEHNRAFIEISTSSVPVLSLPVPSSGNLGGSVVWKMYVDASDFSDPGRRYLITASAFKIGDGIFRLQSASALGTPTQPVSLQSLLLSGLLPLDDTRNGSVVSSEPQDLSIGHRTVHCSHIAVDFSQDVLPGGAQFPPEHIEAWQSPDVPLGSVKVQTTVMGKTYSAELVAFGRGDYQVIVTKPLDSMAPFPGSK